MGTVWKRKGSQYWHIAWMDHEGNRIQENTKTTDKAAAKRILSKYETDAALKRTGTVDAALEGITEQSKRTIEEHLVNFANKLRTAGDCEDHIDQTLKDIRKIASSQKWKRVEQISADGVQQFAAELKARGGRGSSARTIQRYLTAIKSFTKWLADHQKLPRDPLTTVKKPSPKSDRKLERRMMLPEEWQWLKTATESGEEKRNMTGHERRLLYETAICTALRSGELRSLTPGSFHLDEKQPYVICRANRTKNGKQARQYLPHTLAAELKEYMKGKTAKEGVFPMPHESSVAEMVRFDLEAARKLWLDSLETPAEREEAEESDFLLPENIAGKILDFHALRHTCGAWLSRAGLHPQEVQKIMRHGSITLTIDTYGHLFPGQEIKASEELANLLNNPSGALRWRLRAERETAHQGASGRDESLKRNPLRENDLGEKMPVFPGDTQSRQKALEQMLDPRTAYRRVIS